MASRPVQLHGAVFKLMTSGFKWYKGISSSTRSASGP